MTKVKLKQLIQVVAGSQNMGLKLVGGWMGRYVLMVRRNICTSCSHDSGCNKQRRMPTMKISARNQIEGVVKKIEKGEVASTVKIEIAEPAILTSMLTKEAVEDLDLKEGDKVEAVIKATEILILKE